MISSVTQKPLVVTRDHPLYSDITVPVSQLEEVKRLLDAHHIQYEVDEDYYSFDDEPEVTFINLRRGTNAEQVQQILDSIP